MTTVSSMVVVKSTNPTKVTESKEVLVGFSNLLATEEGSISFSSVRMLGTGMTKSPVSSTVKVGMVSGSLATGAGSRTMA